MLARGSQRGCFLGRQIWTTGWHELLPSSATGAGSLTAGSPPQAGGSGDGNHSTSSSSSSSSDYLSWCRTSSTSSTSSSSSCQVAPEAGRSWPADASGASSSRSGAWAPVHTTPWAALTHAWQCGAGWQPATSSRGLHSYAMAPQPLPRFRKVDKELSWKRMVIRIPPEVQVQLDGHQLQLSGRTGSIALNLQHLDPTGLNAMELLAKPAAGSNQSSGALLLCASPSKRYFRGTQTHVENAIRGVTQGYLVGVTVKGVGYRIDPLEGPPASPRWYFERGAEPKLSTPFPYQKPVTALRLKVGFTKSAIFPLPPGVRAFLLRPTLTYLMGVDKALVRSTAMAIRAIRPPNVYTGNGVQLADEQLVLRPRSGKK